MLTGTNSELKDYVTAYTNTFIAITLLVSSTVARIRIFAFRRLARFLASLKVSKSIFKFSL